MSTKVICNGISENCDKNCEGLKAHKRGPNCGEDYCLWVNKKVKCVPVIEEFDYKKFVEGRYDGNFIKGLIEENKKLRKKIDKMTANAKKFQEMLSTLFED